MEIGNWPSSKHIPALYKELKELDLLEHIAELDAFGYTIVPPEKVASPEQHQAAREAALRVASQRRQCRPEELSEQFIDQQELFSFVLWDDPVFEKLVLHPVALGLVQWLLGPDCVLSLCDIWLKGKCEGRTDIHADWGPFEMPTMPPEAYSANFNYLLSDYSKENGGLSFVPSSHRWRRLPSPEESEYWADRAQAVEAPAGSMVIWGDHTWHGSYPKTTDDLRVMVLGMYCRPHMQQQEAFRETVTDEALARNPRRFARLMNVYNSMPWGKTKNTGKARMAPQGYLSLFDNEPAGESQKIVPELDFNTYDLERIRARLRKVKKVDFDDQYK